MNSPFNVLGNRPAITGQPFNDDDATQTPETRIHKMLASSPVFVFMKGTPEEPMCGFSANTTGILNALGKSYQTFNILSDDTLRGAVKEFSNWPTYPQVYVKGKLIGGNDIVAEMHASGELEKFLGEI